MKKRILSLFAAAALMTALIAGCQRRTNVEESPEITPAPTATPDPHEGMVEVGDGAGGLMWVDEFEELVPFALDAGLFSVTDGRAAYSGEDCTLLQGIDVSDHQGEIDWQQVADAGIDFAIIRCGWRGYSGGTLNEDAYFQANIEGALAAGLQVGVYFFSQAVTEVEAAEEAIMTLNMIEGYDVTLPVFFDWEFITNGEAARTDGADGTTVTAACLEFCHLIQSAGYTPGVYGYLNLAYFTYDMDQLKDLTVWMGDPGDQPEYYYEHDFWQYSFTGSVPGIEGDTDMDVMYVRQDTDGTQASDVSAEG